MSQEEESKDLASSFVMLEKPDRPMVADSLEYSILQHVNSVCLAIYFGHTNTYGMVWDCR